MALVYCRECGKKISDLAESCPRCGCPSSAQKTNEKNVLNQVVPCKKCGNKVNNHAEICLRCGSLSPAQNANETNVWQQKGRSWPNEDDDEGKDDDDVDDDDDDIEDLTFRERRNKRNLRVAFSVFFFVAGIILLLFAIASHSRIENQVVFDWARRAHGQNNSPRFRSYLTEYLGEPPDDELFRLHRMRLVIHNQLDAGFYDFIAKKHSTQILLRQAPYFLLPAASFAIAIKLLKSSRKYALME